MNVSRYLLSAYQLVEVLICHYGYQIVRTAQSRGDIWLANGNAAEYPIIRLVYEQEDTQEHLAYTEEIYQAIVAILQRPGQLLSINTSPMQETGEKSQGFMVCVEATMIKYAHVGQLYPKLKHAVHIVEDKDGEFARISRVIEEVQLQAQKKLLRETKKRLFPYVTLAFMLVCTLLSVGCFAVSILRDSVLEGNILFGAYYKMNIVAAKEYWRLFTSMLLHGNVLLLLVCLYGLYQVGKLCEPLYRRSTYVLLLLGSGLVGGLCMLVAEQNVLGYGSGAVIFGISGAYLAVLIEEQRYRHPLIRTLLMRMLWIDLLVCLLPGFSFMAHLAAMGFGFLVGIITSKKPSWQKLRIHTAAALGIFLALLLALGIRTHEVQPFHEDYDQKIIALYRKLGWHSYAEYLDTCYQRQYFGK